MQLPSACFHYYISKTYSPSDRQPQQVLTKHFNPDDVIKLQLPQDTDLYADILSLKLQPNPLSPPTFLHLETLRPYLNPLALGLRLGSLHKTVDGKVKMSERVFRSEKDARLQRRV